MRSLNNKALTLLFFCCFIGSVLTSAHPPGSKTWVPTRPWVHPHLRKEWRQLVPLSGLVDDVDSGWDASAHACERRVRQSSLAERWASQARYLIARDARELRRYGLEEIEKGVFEGPLRYFDRKRKTTLVLGQGRIDFTVVTNAILVAVEASGLEAKYRELNFEKFVGRGGDMAPTLLFQLMKIAEEMMKEIGKSREKSRVNGSSTTAGMEF